MIRVPSRALKRNRSGVLLFAVLVCVGVALALTMTALQNSLRQRRQTGRTLQLQQTRLLLDAAEGSKPFKQWVADHLKNGNARPLKITFELASGKEATVRAVEGEQENFLLTAMIGDAKNEISVTKRSRSVNKK